MSDTNLSSAQRHASTMNNLIAMKRKQTIREVMAVVKEAEESFVSDKFPKDSGITRVIGCESWPLLAKLDAMLEEC